VSRRASLPGAEELFRRTAGRRPEGGREAGPDPQDDKSSSLQVAEDRAASATAPERRSPRHDEKVTFYCTGEDLLSLERARLRLRSEHGIAADRGRIVRAALSYLLEDYEARGEDSILFRKLED
jgi:hypothetical protein